ncbi:unnamed protein product [Lactuca virosa]|uniref:Uncharacterized protein n=1 Tax=Lactuca virosa TaxID=75947 RepID=A0AAU9PA99_9ASTR|nr:unnamed protein product [Lactuca virosa]
MIMIFSGMAYSECITFLEWVMQESINKLYYCEPGKPLLYGITAIRNDGDYASFIFDAYGADGLTSLYVDHDGQGIEEWFGSEIEEEEDGDDSCIDGGENEDEIDNLRDMEAYKFRLAPMSESNLWHASEYTPPLLPVRRTMHGRPATKRKRDATENQSSNKSKKSNQTQENGKEQLRVSKVGKKKNVVFVRLKDTTKEGGAEVNEGDAVNEGDQAVNKGGEAINEGREDVNVSEVYLQQDYDKVELTPLVFDASRNREPSEVHVQQ